MGQTSRESNKQNEWREEAPQHLVNFFDAANNRLAANTLSPNLQQVLTAYCEQIKNGECPVEPDDTVHIVLKRLSDNHE